MTYDKISTDFRLVQINRDGTLTDALHDMPEPVAEACRATARLYDRIGYNPPWVGYITAAAHHAVGGGAFVGPPDQGRVEIAYFTLPEHRSRGYATLTAKSLIFIAREADPNVNIYAKTAPEMNASTAILESLGFSRIGTDADDEIGEAWAWLLS